MTVPEYLLIGISVVGAIMGYFKGFLIQISSLIGLVIGYLIASLFLSQVHLFLVHKGIVSEKSSQWMSFILIILFVLLSVKFLSRISENILKLIGLSFTNRFAGMAFGAFKYFLIVMVLYSFLSYFEILNKENSSSNLLDFISLFKTVVFKYIS